MNRSTLDSSDDSDQSIHLTDLGSAMSRREIDTESDSNKKTLSVSFSKAAGSTAQLEKSLKAEQKRNFSARRSVGFQSTPKRQPPSKPTSINDDSPLSSGSFYSTRNRLTKVLNSEISMRSSSISPGKTKPTLSNRVSAAEERNRFASPNSSRKNPSISHLVSQAKPRSSPGRRRTPLKLAGNYSVTNNETLAVAPAQDVTEPTSLQYRFTQLTHPLFGDKGRANEHFVSSKLIEQLAMEESILIDRIESCLALPTSIQELGDKSEHSPSKCANSNVVYDDTIQSLLVAGAQCLEPEYSWAVMVPKEAAVKVNQDIGAVEDELESVQYINVWSHILHNVNEITGSVLPYSARNYSLYKLLSGLISSPSNPGIVTMRMHIDELRISGLLSTKVEAAGNKEMICFLSSMPLGAGYISNLHNHSNTSAAADTCGGVHIFIYCYAADLVSSVHIKEAVLSGVKAVNGMNRRVLEIAEKCLQQRMCDFVSKFLTDSVLNRLLVSSGIRYSRDKIENVVNFVPVLTFLNHLQNSSDSVSDEFRVDFASLVGAERCYAFINTAAHRVLTQPSLDWHQASGSSSSYDNHNLYLLSAKEPEAPVVGITDSESNPVGGRKNHYWAGSNFHSNAFSPVYSTQTSTGFCDDAPGPPPSNSSVSPHSWLFNMIHTLEPIVVSSVSDLKYSLFSSSGSNAEVLTETKRFVSHVRYVENGEAGVDDDAGYGSYPSSSNASVSLESYRNMLNFIESVDEAASSVVLIPVVSFDGSSSPKGREVCIVMLVNRTITVAAPEKSLCLLPPILPSYSSYTAPSPSKSEQLKTRLQSFRPVDVQCMLNSVRRSINCSNLYTLWKATISHQHSFNLALHYKRLDRRLHSMGQLVSSRVKQRKMMNVFSKWVHCFRSKKSLSIAFSDECVHNYTVDVVNILNDSMIAAHKLQYNTGTSNGESVASLNRHMNVKTLMKLEHYCSLLFARHLYDVNIVVSDDSGNDASMSASSLPASVLKFHIDSNAIVSNKFSVDQGPGSAEKSSVLIGIVYAASDNNSPTRVVQQDIRSSLAHVTQSAAFDDSDDESVTALKYSAETSSSNTDMQHQGRVVALVKITLKKRFQNLVQYNFKPGAVLLLKQLCEITSAVLECCSTNCDNLVVQSKGVKSVAPQLMQSLVPLLFEKCACIVENCYNIKGSDGRVHRSSTTLSDAAAGMPNNNTMHMTLSTIAKWLKILFGAEICLIRLHPGALYYSGDNSVPSNKFDNLPVVSNPSSGELMFSSEDFSTQSSNSIGVSDDVARSVSHYVELAKTSFSSDNSVEFSSSSESSYVKLAARFSDGSPPVIFSLEDPMNGMFGAQSKASGIASLGEVQLFRSSKVRRNELEDVEQSEMVKLVCYALARSLSLRKFQKQLHGAYQQVRKTNVELENALVESKSVVSAESQTATVWRNRLSGALSLAVFMRKVASESGSTEQLAAIVENTLPSVLGCKSVVLMLESPDSEPQRYFSVALSAASANASPSESRGLKMNIAQLNQIPNFVDLLSESVVQAQSKILLCQEGAPISDAFGVLLVFPNEFSGGTVPAMSMWEGMHEVLIASLGACIYGCITKLDVVSTVAKVQDAVKELVHVEEENRQLKMECKKLQEAKDSVQNSHQAALAEIEQLKAKLASQKLAHEEELHKQKTSLELVLADSEVALEQDKKKIAAMYEDIDGVHFQIKQVTMLNKTMSEIMLDYVLDKRCFGSNTVVEWMQELLSDKLIGSEDCMSLSSIKPVFIKQNIDGTLSGGLGIRGIIPAAAEALRNGVPIEIETTLGNNIATKNGSGSVMNRDMYSLFTSASFGETPSNSIRALCIPHPSISAHVECESACFVFVKKSVPKQSVDMYGNESATVSQRADEFTDSEKSVLQFIVWLVTSSLIHGKGKYSMREMEVLEDNSKLMQKFVAKIRDAIDSMERMWKLGVKTRGELEEALRDTVVRLLERAEDAPASGENVVNDNNILYTISVSFYYPSVDILKNIAHSGPAAAPFSNSSISQLLMSDVSTSGGTGLPPDLSEHYHIVLKQGMVLRRGSLMWVPMKSQSGDVTSIMQIERKVTGNGLAAMRNLDMSNIFNESSNIAQTVAMNKSLTDLFLNQHEEEIIKLLCRMTMPMVDNAKIIFDAYGSIKQAGEALSTVQSAKEELEDKLLLEVAQRLEMEETLKLGMNILSDSITHRMDMMNLLDSTRKAMLSATSSDECFVMTPSNYLSEKDSNEDSESDNGYGAALSSDSDRLNGGENSASAAALFYTLEADHRDPTVVRLENGDLETIALLNCRSMTASAPIESTDGIDGNLDGATGVNSATGTPMVWHSWSVRRVQSNLRVSGAEPREDDKNWYSERVLSASTSKADSSQGYHILVIPFALVGGGQGIITLLRRSAPFTVVDRECSKWFSRVLAYSLYMKESISSTLLANSSTTYQTQNTLLAYNELKKKYANMEQELQSVQMDLCVNARESIEDSSSIAPVTDIDEMEFDEDVNDAALVHSYLELLFSSSRDLRISEEFLPEIGENIQTDVEVYLEHDEYLQEQAAVTDEFSVLWETAGQSTSGASKLHVYNKSVKQKRPVRASSNPHATPIAKVVSPHGEVFFYCVVPPNLNYQPTYGGPSTRSTSASMGPTSSILALIRHKHFISSYAKIRCRVEEKLGSATSYVSSNASPPSVLKGLLKLRFAVLLKCMECVMAERVKVHGLYKILMDIKSKKHDANAAHLAEITALVEDHKQSVLSITNECDFTLHNVKAEQNWIEILLFASFKFCSTEPICNNRVGLIKILKKNVSNLIISGSLGARKKSQSVSFGVGDEDSVMGKENIPMNTSNTNLHASALNFSNHEFHADPPVNSSTAVLEWVKTIAEMFSKVMWNMTGPEYYRQINVGMFSVVDSTGFVGNASRKQNQKFEEEVPEEDSKKKNHNVSFDDAEKNDFADFVYGNVSDAVGAAVDFNATFNSKFGKSKKVKKAVTDNVKIMTRELIMKTLRSGKIVLIVAPSKNDSKSTIESERFDKMEADGISNRRNERLFASMGGRSVDDATTEAAVASLSSIVVKDAMKYIKVSSLTETLQKRLSGNEMSADDGEDDEEFSQNTKENEAANRLKHAILIGDGLMDSVVCIACDDYPHGTILLPLTIDMMLPLLESRISASPEDTRHLVITIMPAVERPKLDVGKNASQGIFAVVDGKEDDNYLETPLTPTYSVGKAKSGGVDALVMTACEILCWSIVGKHLQCVIQAANATVYQIFQQKLLGQSIMIGAVRSIVLRENKRKMMKAFELLRSNVRERKIEVILENAPLPEQVSYLEANLGDWSDLVKGLNSSVANGIVQGVTNLWASSCGTLMSLLSSHVSVKGCGLLLADQDGEVVELFVRDLSTPMGGRVRGTSGDGDESIDVVDMDDFSKGIIDIRPPLELGARVQTLAWEILNTAPSVGGANANQRIWKLTKAKTDFDQFESDFSNEEQLWLAPVRTAKNVLGIVRVTIEISSGIGDNFSTSFRSTAGANAPLSSDARVEAALSCLSSFADVFAPLVVASRHIDTYKAQISDCNDALRKGSLKQQLSTTELSITLRKMSLINSVIGICNDVVLASNKTNVGLSDLGSDETSQHFAASTNTSRVLDFEDLLQNNNAQYVNGVNTATIDEDTSHFNQSGVSVGNEGTLHFSTNHSTRRRLQTFANGIAERLKGLFIGCVELSIDVMNLIPSDVAAGSVYNEGAETTNGRSHTVGASGSSTTLTEHILDENGNNILGVMTIVLDHLEQTNSAKLYNASVPARTLDFTSSVGVGGSAYYSQEISLISSLLPSIIMILASVLNNYKRECEYKNKVTTSVRNLKTLENLYEKQHSEAMDMEYKGTNALNANRYYYTLGNVLNICLNYLTVAGRRDSLLSYHPSAAGNSEESEKYTFIVDQNHPVNWIKSIDVCNCLTSVSQQLYTTIMENYHENLSAVVRFGLVVNAETESEDDHPQIHNHNHNDETNFYWHCYYPPNVCVVTNNMDGSIQQVSSPGPGGIASADAEDKLDKSALLFSYLQCHENAEIIADNLARTCVKKTTVSFVDVSGVGKINNGFDASATAGSGNVRIISYPLSYASSEKPIGVLQIVVDASCELGKNNATSAFSKSGAFNSALNDLNSSIFVPNPPVPFDSDGNEGVVVSASQNDSFYADVSQAVANTCYGLKQRYANVCNKMELVQKLTHMNSTKNQAELSKDGYRKRSHVWRCITAIGVELGNCCNKTLHDKLLPASEDATDVTTSMGSNGDDLEDVAYGVCAMVENVFLHNDRLIELLSHDVSGKESNNVQITLHISNEASGSGASIAIPLTGKTDTKKKKEESKNLHTYASTTIAVVDDVVTPSPGTNLGADINSLVIELSIVGDSDNTSMHVVLTKDARDLMNALAFTVNNTVMFIKDALKVHQKFRTFQQVSFTKLSDLQSQLHLKTESGSTLSQDLEESQLRNKMLLRQNSVLKEQFSILFSSRFVPVLKMLHDFVEKSCNFADIIKFSENRSSGGAGIDLNNKPHYEQIMRLLSHAPSPVPRLARVPKVGSRTTTDMVTDVVLKGLVLNMHKALHSVLMGDASRNAGSALSPNLPFHVSIVTQQALAQTTPLESVANGPKMGTFVYDIYNENALDISEELQSVESENNSSTFIAAYASDNTKKPALSSILQCIRFNHIVEVSGEKVNTEVDCLGINGRIEVVGESPILDNIRHFDDKSGSNNKEIVILCFPLPLKNPSNGTSNKKIVSCVVRLVINSAFAAPKSFANNYDALQEQRASSNMIQIGMEQSVENAGEVMTGISATSSLTSSTSGIIQLLQTFANAGSSILQMLVYDFGLKPPNNSGCATVGGTDDLVATTSMERQLAKYKKIYSIVCREAYGLLDPPSQSMPSTSSLLSHHALLSPMVALQDICLRGLSIIRTLLRSDGQAIVLRESSTGTDSDDARDQSYQVIFTGNGISWSGIDRGSFGIASSSSKYGQSSLVEESSRTQKTIVVANVLKDSRYNPMVDGSTDSPTCMLVSNIKGRSGVSIGSLIALKGSSKDDKLSFSKEDSVVGEMIGLVLSISLYWCQGLGSMHHKMANTNKKIQSLEEAVNKLNILS